MNTLMLRIRSNVELPAGSNLTVTGLTGTAEKVETKNTVSRLGDRSQNFDAAVLMGMSSHFFKNEIDWNSGSGKLVLTATSAIPARMTKMIALEIQNGVVEQEPPITKYISISSPKTDTLPDGLCPADSEIVSLIPETLLQGLALGFSVKPALDIKDIGQMSCFPRRSNEISITLKTNFQFRARTGDKMVCTVSGLKGAADGGPMLKSMHKPLHGSSPFSSACWNCECESALSCDNPQSTIGVPGRRQVSSPDPVDSMTFQVAGDIDAGAPIVLRSG